MATLFAAHLPLAWREGGGGGAGEELGWVGGEFGGEGGVRGKVLSTSLLNTQQNQAKCKYIHQFLALVLLTRSRRAGGRGVSQVNVLIKAEINLANGIRTRTKQEDSLVSTALLERNQRFRFPFFVTALNDDIYTLIIEPS